MGTVHITLATAGGPSSHMPAFNAGAEGSETLTSSGSASATTISAKTNFTMAYITTDTAIWVKSGGTPTAAPNDQWYMQADSVLSLYLNAGDKLSVIDA